MEVIGNNQSWKRVVARVHLGDYTSRDPTPVEVDQYLEDRDKLELLDAAGDFLRDILHAFSSGEEVCKPNYS